MRIVVIGGAGLIGSQLVATLAAQGHDAVSTPPRCFDMLTGEGLAPALKGAEVVVDVSDVPFVEDEALVQRFAAVTRTLLEFEATAGVRHHVALTTVGNERLLESGCFRMRLAEEQLIRHAPMPYSILRATPFYESLGAIADMATHGSFVRLPPVLVQPVAASDVVRRIATVAVGTPLNGAVEFGGPEPFYLDALVQRVLGANRDQRTVVTDGHARYAGARLDEHSLMADEDAELGEVRFADWLHETVHREVNTNGAVSVTRPSLHAHEFRVSDVLPGSVLLVGEVAVFNVAGGLCATQARCTHRSGPLGEGVIDGSTVTCPLHGAQFNVWTGAVLRGPAKSPLKTYPVSVDGDVGRILIDAPSVVVAG
jgi:nitrite reductase/ring-hydroxylating ferredoxin subunit/uncharacterized protein YbjT (DUF2867 family)